MFALGARERPDSMARRGWRGATGRKAKVAEHTSTEIQALAQALYEASDPEGLAWARRGRTIRDAWVESARKKLAEADSSAERQ